MSGPTPLDPLKVIRDRLAEAATKLGLELRQFAVVVGEGDSPDHVQAVFSVTDLITNATNSEPQVDLGALDFDALEAQMRVEAADERDTNAVEDLQRLLDRNRSQTGDDDT